jgi:hypothetical protein
MSAMPFPHLMSQLLEMPAAPSSSSSSLSSIKRAYAPSDVKAAVDYCCATKPLVWSTLVQAAGLHGIPTSTLYQHVRASSSGVELAEVGHPTVLDKVDELALAEWIRYCTFVNMPAQLIEIKIAAAKLADARHGNGNGFHGNGGLPSKKWWRSFNKRQKAQTGEWFSVRRAQHKHYNLPSRDAIATWSKNLLNIIIENGITAERIFNVDETGIDGGYGQNGKHVVPHQQRKALVVSNRWRGHFTAVLCIGADGSALPPHWIMQSPSPLTAQVAAAYLDGVSTLIPNTGLSCTSSGWIDSPTWSMWIQFFLRNLAVPPTKENPVLLILDNHETRFNWSNIKYAMDNNIIMYAVPPNTTSICQPLDVNFNGHFKVILLFLPCPSASRSFRPPCPFRVTATCDCWLWFHC